MAINKENVRKWVEALRSGKYEQGQERLVRNNKYCCLGVACELAGLPKASDGNGFIAQYTLCLDYLPIEVQQWLGVSSRNPIVNGEELAQWNDWRGKTFAEIADMIEKEWLRD